MMYRPRPGVSLALVSQTLDDELFAALTESNIATVEIAQALDGQLPRAELRDRLAACGVRPASVHARFGADVDVSSDDEGVRGSGLLTCIGAVDMASELGAPLVVVHASAEPVARNERDRRRANAIAALRNVAAHAADLGMRLGVEFLPRSCLGNDVEDVLRIVDGIGDGERDDRTGVCLDVNHLMDRHAHLADIVRRLGARLIALHISDYDGVDEKHWMPLEGVIDWKALLAALDEVAYAGPFNYECAPPGRTYAEKLAAVEENCARLVDCCHDPRVW